MENPVDIQTLQTHYQAHRQNYSEPFRLRIHRSLSWLDKAACTADEDLDNRFIMLWIAFNAAYAKETAAGLLGSERSGFRHFLQTLCRLDKGQQIYKLVWESFPGNIRLLLDNRYIFQPFWDFHNGLISETAWQDDFARARQKAHKALAAKDTDTVLAVVFDRLYTLRNQLIHGGATCNSSVNRTQLKDGCAILLRFMPLMLWIMQQNHQYPDWGQPFYPVVKD